MIFTVLIVILYFVLYKYVTEHNQLEREKFQLKHLNVTILILSSVFLLVALLDNVIENGISIICSLTIFVTSTIIIEIHIIIHNLKSNSIIKLPVYFK